MFQPNAERIDVLMVDTPPAMLQHTVINLLDPTNLVVRQDPYPKIPILRARQRQKRIELVILIDLTVHEVPDTSHEVSHRDRLQLVLQWSKGKLPQNLSVPIHELIQIVETLDVGIGERKRCRVR